MPSKRASNKPPGKDPAPAQPQKHPRKADSIFPPLAWMLAVSRTDGLSVPRRILLCGAVSEAAGLAKSLLQSEVVVLDSSPERARALRATCSRRKLANLRVEVGRIDQEALPELTGGNFDLVFAPKVFRGCADVGRAMENLALCTAQDGSLYIEADGSGHPSARLDAIMEHVLQPASAEIADKLLRVASGMCEERPPLEGEAPASPATCKPFKEWIELAERCGLHLAGCTLPGRCLPGALPMDWPGAIGLPGLTPLCALLEAMAAPPVLQMLLTRTPLPEPPWSEPMALQNWRSHVLFWPRNKLHPMAPPFSNFFEVGIDIPGLLDVQKLLITAFLLEFLRLSDGLLSIREILGSIPHPANVDELTHALFFLHHTNILRLLPPV
jgi:hypothetical protein